MGSLSDAHFSVVNIWQKAIVLYSVPEVETVVTPAVLLQGTLAFIPLWIAYCIEGLLPIENSRRGSRIPGDYAVLPRHGQAPVRYGEIAPVLSCSQVLVLTAVGGGLKHPNRTLKPSANSCMGV